METPKAPDTLEYGDRAINADVAIRTAEAFDPGEEFGAEPAPGSQAGRIARSTAFFSIATAASRVAGLAREIVAAGYYGISGPMSAFTIAFQVPNLVRALFADAALQPAFVPVFTELVGRKAYREAFRLASTLLLLITMVLGVITAFFVLLAPVIMPIFAPGFEGELLELTVSLSQVLFPILIMLGVSGVVVGILNSYDRFGAFAISPLFWNLSIIVVLVALQPLFHGRDKIYAYAIGILVGTLVQLLIPAFDLRNTPFRFSSGTAKDESTAAELFLKAARRGSAIAQDRLARILMAGRGMPADAANAVKWHLIAKAGGDADPELDAFAAKQTAAVREAADKAAKKWLSTAAPRS